MINPFLLSTADLGCALRPVCVPGSKSVCNRALLLAALAPGVSRLEDGLEADDTARMRSCLKTLGIPVVEQGTCWEIEGGVRPTPAGPLQVGASGTTLRFLLPWLALAATKDVTLAGDPRLFERPLGGLLQALESFGASWEPSRDSGVLRPAQQPPTRLELEVDASASSQFLTGLAMAAACLPEGGRLTWAKPPASISYLELTAHWMAAFGCETRLEPGGWEIPGKAVQPQTLRIPGDWSGAAAFLCAAAVMGSRVEVSPLDIRDPQGDRSILTILEEAGCILERGADRIGVQGPLLRGIQADLTLCPDLGPVLAAMAALAPGPSVLTGLQTLPLKECNRLEASAELVEWLGGRAEILGDHTMKIQPGPCPGERAPFDPRNDHRMAFAAALGALRCGGLLLNPGCVSKTLPTFWEDWAFMLGAPR